MSDGLDYFGALLRSTAVTLGPLPDAPPSHGLAQVDVVEVHDERIAATAPSPAPAPSGESTRPRTPAEPLRNKPVDAPSARPAVPHALHERNSSLAQAPATDANTVAAPSFDAAAFAIRWVRAGNATAAEPTETPPQQTAPLPPAAAERVVADSPPMQESARPQPSRALGPDAMPVGAPASAAQGAPPARRNAQAPSAHPPPAEPQPPFRPERPARPLERAHEEHVEISIGAISVRVEAPAPAVQAERTGAERTPSPARERSRPRSNRLARRYLGSF